MLGRLHQDLPTSRDSDEQVQSTVDFDSLEELGSVTKRSIRLFFFLVFEEMPYDCSSGTLHLGNTTFKASQCRRESTRNWLWEWFPLQIVPMEASESLRDPMATIALFGADQTAEVSAVSCAAQVNEETWIIVGATKLCNVISDGRGPQQI